ncbi:MAG: hypothetical protein WKG03_18515, partial [Telluria sp.]
MNCIDRSSRNHPTGAVVGVAGSAAARFGISALAMSVALAWGTDALAVPVGGVVKNGAAVISTTPGATVINQSTQNVVIN